MICHVFWHILPEEAVILHADFPQPFGRSVILQLESHRVLKLLRLSEEKLVLYCSVGLSNIHLCYSLTFIHLPLLV